MLSESKIRWLWSEAHNDTSDRMAYQVLAEMVETEVRKQDDALIQQLSDALEWLHLGIGPARDPMRAITAARARLGEKT